MVAIEEREPREVEGQQQAPLLRRQQLHQRHMLRRTVRGVHLSDNRESQSHSHQPQVREKLALDEELEAPPDGHEAEVHERRRWWDRRHAGRRAEAMLVEV